jgi:hypothetical protein
MSTSYTIKGTTKAHCAGSPSKYDCLDNPLASRLPHCALPGSAESALALWSLLRRRPLEVTAKKRLVASWLVRGRLIENVGEPDVTPRRSHHRLVPKLLGEQEDES